MRVRLVVNTLGIVLLLFAPFLLVPLVAGLLLGEGLHDVLYWYGSVFALAALVGGSMYWLTRATTEELRDREAFVIVSGVWLLIGAFGALPYYLTEVLLPVEAYFESISGFTTTGATVFQMAGDGEGYWEGVPKSLLLWRSLTQWLGGMGIIVLAAVVLSRLTGGGIQLMRAEMPGTEEVTKLSPQLKQTALLLWWVYAAFTLAEIVALVMARVPLYDAVANSFSTLSTGGFSPQARSIESYESAWVESIIILFMFMAGVNFILHYHWLSAFLRPPEHKTPTTKAQWRAPVSLPERLKTAFSRLTRDSELLTYLGVVFGACLLISIGLLAAGGMESFLQHPFQSIGHAVRMSLFQVVSIGTTTGFSSTDYVGTSAFPNWAPALLFILFLLMFIGGCAGSTAGGIKIVRLSVMLKALRRELIRVIHPRAVLPLKIGPRTLPEGMVRSVAVFFFIYILLFMGGALAVAALEPDLNLIEAMSASIASLSNIGPALGTLGPAGNYGGLSSPTQIVLVLLMWLGRLEIITGLLLFFPSSYKD